MDANLTLTRSLLELLPASRVKHRLIDRLAYASDAGFYQLTPQAVVQPVNETEVQALLRLSQEVGIPVVFRTGGTSLSGQAITDGLLVDLSKHWKKIHVEADGHLVRVQPGIIGGMVNTVLKKYHRKIGPDPSSINAAMMGGILSNNASGMCCGVQQNSYHTVRYVRFMLPDGKIFSTEVPEDYLRFETECGEIFTRLASLRQQIVGNEELTARIRHKYKTKNTVGYSLNALLDYDHPLDMLAHLLIGAEGTLAFISEAVLETFPDFPFKSTGLLFFENIYAACQAIVPLTEAGASAVELMDRASLRAIENQEGVPSEVRDLPVLAAALLVEFQEADEAALAARVQSFLTAASSLTLLSAPVFTTDVSQQEKLWKIRKGLFPAVGAVRASGSTVILEDIAVPVEKLGDAVTDLQRLFVKFHYDNAIIFGHAKDGNIHFVVTQTLSAAAEITRYEQFMDEVVALVVQRYDGALKAEHGTGRNMAPFVETEWGGEAYAIMKALKEIIDPHNRLNPGVIINEDPRVHVKHLKQLPSVESEVDKCIECGFCEPKCPSRALTLSPRQRIVVRRAMASMETNGQSASRQLHDEFLYDGLETCAVDGMCATTCPVDINTGDLVKRLRREQQGAVANRLAEWVAGHFAFVQWGIRAALRTGTLLNAAFGKTFMYKTTAAIRRLIPVVPLWSVYMPRPPRLDYRPSGPNGQDVVVYFPACISRMMGSRSDTTEGITDVFQVLAERAGFVVRYPEHVNGLCCGQMFSSKGYAAASRVAANRVVESLWEVSSAGRYPVVTDVSSCAFTLRQMENLLEPENKSRYRAMSFLDSIEFMHDHVRSRLTIHRKKDAIVLHPVCSLHKMKTYDKFVKLASAFAVSVEVPAAAGCCGMAGDRGFLFPELTASASAPEASEVSARSYDGCYSSTKTCEIALSEATQKRYDSFMVLMKECTD